jgi:hypothetical protein
MALTILENQAPSMADVVSQLCTQAQFETDDYEKWRQEMGLHFSYHRKHWEFAFILQALKQAGMLAPSKTGLGFGVGREPLACVMAKSGCELVATDLAARAARSLGWLRSKQHARSLRSLFWKGICDWEFFQKHVRFRAVDMNDIPSDIGSYDFVWSACALEHLGSLAKGSAFVLNSLACLKPGGVAVHTTEYNAMSDSRTVDNDGTVLYRKRDILELAREAAERGYAVTLNFTEGQLPADQFIDVPPFRDCPHLRMLVKGFITTSFGLIISRTA